MANIIERIKIRWLNTNYVKKRLLLPDTSSIDDELLEKARNTAKTHNNLDVPTIAKNYELFSEIFKYTILLL